MFLPQAMTEIELVVPESDVLAVTKLLGGKGIFHQTDASYLSPGAGFHSSEYWQQKTTACSMLEKRILTLMETLGIEESEPQSNIGGLSVIDVEMASLVVDHVEQEIQEVAQDLEREQKKLEQLQSYIYQLEPIVHLDIDIAILRNLRYLVALLGTMPVDNVERLRTSLIRIPFVLLTLRRDDRQALVLLFGDRRDADILERAARSAYLNLLKVPEEYRGTPDGIITAIRAGIARTEGHIAERKAAIEKLHDTRERQLRTLLWRVRMGRMVAQTITHYGKRRYTYLIVGWVPTAQVGSLTRQLQQTSDKIFVEANPSGRREGSGRVPTALDNPDILGPFQQLVTTYAYPLYNEIDPTPLLALTFPVIFGTMFGDVGHGLMLVLLGALLLSRRIRILRGLAGLGSLILICGLSAVAFGFLYGSVFGLEDVLPALWLHPLEHITDILLATVAAGTVLLNIGFLSHMINAYLARDWGSLLFSRSGVAGTLFYWSLLAFAVKAFAPGLPIPVSRTTLILFAGVSGGVVMFGDLLSNLILRHRPLIEDSLGTYLIQAGFELFETLITFLSNTLSYVRMGAFAVAHGGLSAVVFILADMVSPTRGIGYWLVVVLGTISIVGFEGLIVGIQTLRLEYYEFFSKFFTGGGSSYKPFRLLPRVEK